MQHGPPEPQPWSGRMIAAFIVVIALGAFASSNLEAGGTVAVIAAFVTGGALLIYGLSGPRT